MIARPEADTSAVKTAATNGNSAFQWNLSQKRPGVTAYNCPGNVGLQLVFLPAIQ